MNHFWDVATEIKAAMERVYTSILPTEKDYRRWRILSIQLWEEYRQHEFQEWMGRPFHERAVETNSVTASSHR